MRFLTLLLLLTLTTWLTVAQGSSRNSNSNKKGRSSRKRVQSLEERVAALEKASCQRVECPCGYVHFRQSCYKFVMGHVNNGLNWTQARDQCRSEGGNLVTVENRKVERFLARFLERNHNKSKIKLFTGLIYTDHRAEHPFDLVGDEIRSASGLRWTSSGQCVNTARMPCEDSTNFVPKVKGTLKAPLMDQVPMQDFFDSYSCIVLHWNPKLGKKEGLDWLHSSCRERLSYICEVRPPKRRCSTRRKRKQRARNKRSVLAVNDDITNTSLDEDDDSDDYDMDDFEYDSESDEDIIDEEEDNKYVVESRGDMDRKFNTRHGDKNVEEANDGEDSQTVS